MTIRSQRSSAPGAPFKRPPSSWRRPTRRPPANSCVRAPDITGRRRIRQPQPGTRAFEWRPHGGEDDLPAQSPHRPPQPLGGHPCHDVGRAGHAGRGGSRPLPAPCRSSKWRAARPSQTPTSRDWNRSSRVAATLPLFAASPRSRWVLWTRRSTGAWRRCRGETSPRCTPVPPSRKPRSLASCPNSSSPARDGHDWPDEEQLLKACCGPQR